MIFPALQNLCKPLPQTFLAFLNVTSWKWKNITPGFIFLKIYLPHFNCKSFFWRPGGCCISNQRIKSVRKTFCEVQYQVKWTFSKYVPAFVCHSLLACYAQMWFMWLYQSLFVFAAVLLAFWNRLCYLF